MSDLIKDYMGFLDRCKTERRCVEEAVRLAEKAGYKNLESVGALKAGDKVYYVKMGKALMLFHVGKGDFSAGMNILGAHIDSPRLDVKQAPLYEKDGIVYLNTHYYGGIKKYQWLTLPLALHGVVFLADGTKIDVNVGDGEDDPVFCISDILPHVAYAQMAKTASEFVEGEKLDLILGCSHVEKKSDSDKASEEGGEKEPNKKKILSILKDKYGFEEEDFISAELEVVPAGKARYVGFDRSLVIGYGQDDRVCSYTSLRALLEAETGERTLCCILADKEEIGSNGATGMCSQLLGNAVAEVIERLYGAEDGQVSRELVLRRALANSYMLSSDVNSAYDPLNPDLYDKQNSSFLSRGVVFNKYTGSRGKSAASDANPEFIARLRGQMKQAGVEFQAAEMCRVDAGGGGTIAKYCAEYGMQVIDCGVPVMSMHAPWELTSVFDIEQAYLCYKAFLKMI